MEHHKILYVTSEIEGDVLDTIKQTTKYHIMTKLNVLTNSTFIIYKNNGDNNSNNKILLTKNKLYGLWIPED